ncbi:hypothetical protein SeMB42_g04944 [Synchytrium endobioticum]|uniref:XPG-I domain-containing protein n=1 Tax=Synchytrium endobioticum TaxID=286115 RepID=A0A507CUZ3_9FUNG|nr:hypothetical protein SeMB42_g04944 [Synchytrium endobioticum]
MFPTGPTWMVIDGMACESKVGTHAIRNQGRAAAVRQLEEEAAKIEKAVAQGKARKSKSFYNLKQLVTALGKVFSVIEAPDEADVEIARRVGERDMVISGDCDLFFCKEVKILSELTRFCRGDFIFSVLDKKKAIHKMGVMTNAKILKNIKEEEEELFSRDYLRVYRNLCQTDRTFEVPEKVFLDHDEGGAVELVERSDIDEVRREVLQRIVAAKEALVSNRRGQGCCSIAYFISTAVNIVLMQYLIHQLVNSPYLLFDCILHISNRVSPLKLNHSYNKGPQSFPFNRKWRPNPFRPLQSFGETARYTSKRVLRRSTMKCPVPPELSRSPKVVEDSHHEKAQRVIQPPKDKNKGKSKAKYVPYDRQSRRKLPEGAGLSRGGPSSKGEQSEAKPSKDSKSEHIDQLNADSDSEDRDNQESGGAGPVKRNTEDEANTSQDFPVAAFYIFVAPTSNEIGSLRSWLVCPKIRTKWRQERHS